MAPHVAAITKVEGSGSCRSTIGRPAEHGEERAMINVDSEKCPALIGHPGLLHLHPHHPWPGGSSSGTRVSVACLDRCFCWSQRRPPSPATAEARGSDKLIGAASNKNGARCGRKPAFLSRDDAPRFHARWPLHRAVQGEAERKCRKMAREILFIHALYTRGRPISYAWRFWAESGPRLGRLVRV